MTINLTPEQERIVNEAVRSGHFRSPEEVIANALATLRQIDPASISSDDNGNSNAAVREMLDFVKANHVRLQDVSVKQLIREVTVCE